MDPSLMAQALLTTDLPGVELRHRGKVRDVYDLGDRLLIIATDRVSAFDVVLPNGVPTKGTMLTQLSSFWFDKLGHIIGNHLISTNPEEYPEPLPRFADQLRGRSQYVYKADRFDVECVVRGYLIGSGWKDYQATGSVCGIELPPGLRQADRLPELIFTPATKADTGHDENISFDVMAKIVGADWAAQLHEVSLRLYTEAAAFAAERGIIIADTKFEFGLVDGELILIDEVLTPDSSRFWPAAQYAPGQSPPSYDKQFVRDYLQTLDWDKTPPGPELPGEIISRTAAKYAEAYLVLTGQPLPDFNPS